MVLSILLGAVVAILVGFFIILISPFSFLFQCNYISKLESASVRMFWLHPWVLYGSIEFKKNLLDIRLFNRFIVYSRSFTEEPGGTRPEREENPSAAPLKGETASPKKTTDARTVHETESTAQQTEHLLSPSPDHEKSGVAQPEEDEKKKEGLIAKLHSVRERYKNGSLRKALFFLRQESWRYKILRWLGQSLFSFFHIFVIHHIKMYVRASLPEPSATGKLYGYWTGISHALMNEKIKKHEIVFEPAFNEECLKVEASLRIQTSLLRFMVPVVIMVMTFPYFSTVRVWLACGKNTRKEKSA
jgi:hypothetical protein